MVTVIWAPLEPTYSFTNSDTGTEDTEPSPLSHSILWVSALYRRSIFSMGRSTTSVDPEFVLKVSLYVA